MRKNHFAVISLSLLTSITTLISGCETQNTGPAKEPPNVTTQSPQTNLPVNPPSSQTNSQNQSDTNNSANQSDQKESTGSDTEQVANQPTAIAVLVNKTNELPANYRPSDLVEPKVPFIFSEKSERRLMRKEAAEALEQLFAGAKKDGIYLAGVSGYRSYEMQKSLFQYYVSVQGEAEARKFSAVPGQSEHQTGLAMDVSGSSGKCAADDCFAGTPEANWLAEHAPEYGFIIRYPKGKESITGYNYEPWHIRYVGKEMSTEIAQKGLTFEEYLKNSAVVSK